MAKNDKGITKIQKIAPPRPLVAPTSKMSGETRGGRGYEHVKCFVLSDPIWECVEATIAWFEKVEFKDPPPPHPRERHAHPHHHPHT